MTSIEFHSEDGPGGAGPRVYIPNIMDIHYFMYENNSANPGIYLKLRNGDNLRFFFKSHEARDSAASEIIAKFNNLPKEETDTPHRLKEIEV